MPEYSIKDLEKLSNIKAHTIRIWEKRYGIIKPDRTATNRRRYTDHDLRKLINISILNRKGYKISNIAALTLDEMEEKVSNISRDINQSDVQIESLVMAMINLDERAFSDLVNRSILERGLEDTFTGIIFPFLERVGVLWLTGSITPAQEHFVSNLVRQKLFANIDSQMTTRIPDRKKVLLFLPENELHEIGLLFYTYITRKSGHDVLYLGPQTPLDSVRKLIKTWKADILVTASSSGFSGISNDEYILTLSGAFRDQLIIVSGDLARNTKVKLPRNVRTVDTPGEYLNLLIK
ncbi:MAG: MerR family transcriptional regulator [Bacteroidales bacterium]|nr:MerR family transcriptional regulator [Bacteroidales bacterium]